MAPQYMAAQYMAAQYMVYSVFSTAQEINYCVLISIVQNLTVPKVDPLARMLLCFSQ